MPITDAFMLAKDVAFVEVTSLPADIRRRIDSAPGDRVLTRPRVRAFGKLIDQAAATLLEEFRSPSTIPAAVLNFSLSRGLDPQETLDSAYPLLRRLLDVRILASIDDGPAPAIAPCFEAGDEVDGFTVISLVSLLEDTEVYQVRGPNDAFGALKISRAGHEGKMAALLANEVRAYQALDGIVTPCCLAGGAIDERPYVVTSWCAGSRADAVAGEARRAGDLAALGALARAIAVAYAHLHDQGIVHGDVHPGNVLVKADGGVELIDFGYAGPTEMAGTPGPGRAGVPFYFEPECARALLAGETPPRATPEGEQYAVAALVYSLVTGGNYLDFSLHDRETMRQISEDAPIPFASQGARPWPALEAVLGRALSKAPADRFAAMRLFAEALSSVTPPAPLAGARAGDASHPLTQVLEGFLARVSPGGERYEQGVTEAPRASVCLGAAGIAYALYRIALAREEASLLALADVWMARARRATASDDAFYAPALELTPEKIGRASTFHMAPGLSCVQALVSYAMGDRRAGHGAARALAEAARDPGGELDVSFGRAGLLLAFSSILEACREADLSARGHELSAGLWAALARLDAVGRAREIPYLGVAHGWAGFVHATLRWCAVTGSSPPPGALDRLVEFTALGEPWGRGVRFRRVLSPDGRLSKDYLAGWCNGSAGMIHLFLAAYASLRDERFLELAERSAWAAWEPDEQRADLCCGSGGRAYGLIALHRVTGERAWLGRARELAAHAAMKIGEQATPGRAFIEGKLG